MTSTKGVPRRTLQNTCVQRKRRGRSHRPHDGPLAPGTKVLILDIEPGFGWSWGEIVAGCQRGCGWRAPNKYLVRIEGPGLVEVRLVRRSLLRHAAPDE